MGNGWRVGRRAGWQLISSESLSICLMAVWTVCTYMVLDQGRAVAEQRRCIHCWCSMINTIRSYGREKKKTGNLLLILDKARVQPNSWQGMEI
jgi:hypothetical protein